MLNRSTQVYRRLLQAYPADFRCEYGALMAQLFRDGLRDAVQQGVLSAGIFWLHALFDLIRNAIGERMSTFRLLPRSGGSVSPILGILVAAATGLMLVWTVAGYLPPAADPASGALQEQIAPVMDYQPGLALLPLVIWGGGSLILAWYVLSGRGGRWLAWRSALVNFLTSLTLLAAPQVMTTVISSGGQPDRMIITGVAYYPTPAFLVLVLIYGLLVVELTAGAVFRRPPSQLKALVQEVR